jgi:hypothetical protein
MMAFATGQAQPQQPQSQGTPYNPQQGQNFGGQRQVQFGMPDQQRNQAMTAWAQPKQQLLQWGQNLPQFQQHQPQQGMQPQDLWGRNSALVQQINDSQANQQVGTWLGQGAPPPNWGDQQFNPQQMLTQAQTMLQQGWQNPFAAQPAAQPEPAPPGPAVQANPSPPAQPAQRQRPANPWAPAPWQAPSKYSTPTPTAPERWAAEAEQKRANEQAQIQRLNFQRQIMSQPHHDRRRQPPANLTQMFNNAVAAGASDMPGWNKYSSPQFRAQLNSRLPAPGRR